MRQVQLNKTIKLPENRQELGKENILDKHERYLRTLIKNGFTPIYIGDKVKVSDRWASYKGKNPHNGKTGEVIGIECSLQGALNIDYLIYEVRANKGESFQTYQYTLDRTHQSTGNRLLERLLRETNNGF